MTEPAARSDIDRLALVRFVEQRRHEGVEVGLRTLLSSRRVFDACCERSQRLGDGLLSASGLCEFVEQGQVMPELAFGID